MLRCLLIVSLLWFVAGHRACAQPADSLPASKNERPEKPRFILEADQRFFYFKDASPPLLRNPVNVWGARAGFLLPNNIKLGVGYYFTTQHISDSWDEFQVTYRRIQYATVYVEPYFFRRKFWELSAPIEVGVGSARYDLFSTDTQKPDRRNSIAVPLSVGLSISAKFPEVFGIRPLRWFGVNLMTGYRYTLQNRVPLGPVTLNGVYYSVSPAVFLDRIYQDYANWRKSRRSRKG
ncbi:hypothetical protein HNV11_14175 [Spirosoma taeanense]|uniref:Outer membrane protein beta-barrel domain-containing protein n=1 Tax=Spirosoma taeanense TaxID=2735870 RepID=A0A6M5YB34_9BACT|nr:hypothetical protein [Spirosoma taeanense]QJW90443.1 hypothetical protein HNV11_14175 [Spirosoma taeanense]